MGYVNYLDDAHLIKGNSLAVGMMGMRFFYMEHDFYAGQFTKTAFPLFDGFNEKIALWFISWFNKSSKKYLGCLVRDFESAFYETEIDVPYFGEVLATEYIESRVRELEEERVRELEEERVRELEAYLTASNFSDCSLTLAEKNALSTMSRQSNCKLFKVDSLFECSGTKSLDEGKLDIVKEGINFVSRKSDNYSISGRIAPQVFEPNDPNTITSNVVGRKIVRYQEEPYYCSQNINKLTPKFQLTPNRAFFIMAHLQKFLSSLGKDYDGYKLEELTQHSLLLPVTDDGSLDFALMENYINAIKKQIISQVKEFIEREHRAYRQVVPITVELQEEQAITPLHIHDSYQHGRIPLYTLRAACGYFDDGQLPEAEGWIDATGLGFTPDKDRYFAVHAKGDSMLPKIHDGDICIFEWYHAGSRNGEIVLSQSNEYDDAYGGRYTIKRYYSEKTVTDEGWQHTKVELQPLNPDFDSIVLSGDESVRTIGIFKCVIQNIDD